MISTTLTHQISQTTGVAASRIHSRSKTIPVCKARRLLIKQLTAAGWSGQEVADHLGISRRAVCQHLSKTRNTKTTPQ
jgi:predicted transcriptional regulator